MKHTKFTEHQKMYILGNELAMYQWGKRTVRNIMFKCRELHAEIVLNSSRTDLKTIWKHNSKEAYRGYFVWLNDDFTGETKRLVQVFPHEYI